MQQRIIESVNSILIEILAATASKDYEDRRQQEGIEANRDKFKGQKLIRKQQINVRKYLKQYLLKLKG